MCSNITSCLKSQEAPIYVLCVSYCGAVIEAKKKTEKKGKRSRRLLSLFVTYTVSSLEHREVSRKARALGISWVGNEGFDSLLIKKSRSCKPADRLRDSWCFWDRY